MIWINPYFIDSYAALEYVHSSSYQWFERLKYIRTCDCICVHASVQKPLKDWFDDLRYYLGLHQTIQCGILACKKQKIYEQ